MSNLLIFDPADNLLAILSNEAENACAFWDAPFREEINKSSTFEFTAEASHEDSKYLIAENQVAFLDKDSVFRLFVIKEPERINGQGGPEIHAVCESAILELNDEIIEDLRPYDTTLKDALTKAINGTRWQVGQTGEDFDINSTNFYYISVTEAIEDIINTWGGELRERIEIQGNKIVGRYIDVLTIRGTNTGKRWEMDKDILSLRHQVLSYPKTALYGRGASLELEDEEGNATGGYSRKITFEDVEWQKSKGHPIDKPKGQEWVGDPEALNIYGRPNKDGTFRHRKGIFESSEQEDPAKLLLETWTALQEQKHPLDNYEMDVFLLEEITGYEHEKVRLGDITVGIDRSFARPIEVEERIIAFEYDVADPNHTGKVELGQPINLYDADLDNRVDQLERKMNDRASIWDKATKVVESANGKNKNFYSPVEPEGDLLEGDLWFKGMDGEYTQTYLYNGEQWVLLVDLEVSNTKELAEEAANRAQDAVDRANEAAGTAQEALEDAQSAFDIASGVNNTASDAVNQANLAQQNAQDAVNRAIALENEVAEVWSGMNALDETVTDSIFTLSSRADDLLAKVNDQAANLLAADGKITSIAQEIDTINCSLSLTINTLSELEDTISEQQTAITLLDEKIELRATKTSVDMLTGRVSSAESSITTMAGQITLKANVEEVNNKLDQKVDTTTYSNKMSQLDVNMNGITANVESVQKSVTDVGSRLTTAQSQIEAQAGQISLKANSSDVYTKTEADGKVTSAINTVKAEIKVTTDGISQNVSSLTTTVNGIEIGGRNLLKDTSEQFVTVCFGGWDNYLQTIVLADYGLKAGDKLTARVYLKPTVENVKVHLDFRNSLNSSYKQFFGNTIEGGSEGYSVLTVEIPATTSTGEAVTKVQFSIRHNLGTTPVDAVQYKKPKLEKGNKATDYTPSPEDVDGAISELQSYASSINQKADSIQLNVSSLTQTVNGKVNTSTFDSKMSQVDVSLNGITGRVSSTETNINNLTGEVTSTKNRLASLEVTSTGIQTNVSTITDKINLNTDSTNYNPNPVFANGKNTYYTQASAVASSTTEVPTGAPKQYVGKQTVRDNYISDYFSVKEGDKFKIEGWVAGTSNTNCSFGIGLHFLDESGNNHTWSPNAKVNAGATAWTYIETTITVPAGRTRANFFSQINNSVTGGTGTITGAWFFTDIRVTKLTPKSNVDGLDSSLSSLNTSITQLSSSISLKASQTDLDSFKQTTNTKFSSLTLTTDGIQSQVNNKAEKSQVTQLAGVVDTKISTTDANNKFATQSQLTQTSTSLTSSITSLQGDVVNAKSQLSQLSDAINLRVTKNDVVSQINIDSSGVLIQGKKLLLDGNVTVNGEFKVNNANIQSIDAGKLTSGYVNAARIAANSITSNHINVNGLSAISADIGSIKAGTLQGVRVEIKSKSPNDLGLYSYLDFDPGFAYIFHLYDGNINTGRRLFMNPNEIRFWPTGGTTGDKLISINKDGINVFGKDVYVNNTGFGTLLAEANPLRAGGIRTNGTDLYLGVDGTNGGEVRVTNLSGYNHGSGISYRPIRASAFNTSSLEAYKQDILKVKKNALDIINSSVIYQYRLKSEVQENQNIMRYGLVIGREVSPQVISPDGEAIEQYSMTSFSWLGIQELYKILKAQDTEIFALKRRLEELEKAA
ncbi:gp58-like family protein [Niallia taxi]|uniref:gp58-like family protein n=1 Tax=Niallia taxi TaxID=2499688 RepID=UPI003F600DA2